MSFTTLNVNLSRRFNELIPRRLHGAACFQSVVHEWLKPGHVLLDIGGGRLPLFSGDIKRSMGIETWGLDIDPGELEGAAPGSYDRQFVVSAEVMNGVPDGSVDVACSRAVAEHVPDTAALVRSTARVLKPGGIALHFMPNKFALFALANVLLPERLRMGTLRSLRDIGATNGGFPAFYKATYPTGMERLARNAGLDVVDTRCYFASAYLERLAPLHVMHALWCEGMKLIGARNLCESFTIICRKPQAH